VATPARSALRRSAVDLAPGRQDRIVADIDARHHPGGVEAEGLAAKLLVHHHVLEV